MSISAWISAFKKDMTGMDMGTEVFPVSHDVVVVPVIQRAMATTREKRADNAATVWNATMLKQVCKKHKFNFLYKNQRYFPKTRSFYLAN